MPRKNLIILICLFLSGIATFIDEIIWPKPLSLIIGSTTYSFSIILIAIMTGLTLGSWIFGKLIDKISNPEKYFGYFQIIIGFYNGFLILIFSQLPIWFLNLYQIYSNQNFFILAYIVIFFILLIPAILTGGSWPIANKMYISNLNNVGKDTGLLYSINSLGCIIGALLGGFIFLPILGVKNSLILAGLTTIISGIIFLISQKSQTLKNLTIFLIVLLPLFSFNYNIKLLNIGLFAILNPEISIQKILEDLQPIKIVFSKENALGSIIVADIANQIKILKINGKIQCSNTIAGIETIRNIARIPIELFKLNFNKLPENALNIGLGCGITSGYIANQNIKTTTLEINPNVSQVINFFENVNYNILKNQNHRLIIDDARKWLFFNSKEKFDLITSQPSDIWQENSGFIISKEFFEIIKSRLTPNGIFSQWMPLYEMDEKDFKIFLKTFQSVFPNFYIYSLNPTEEGIFELLLIAQNKPLNLPANLASFYINSAENIKLFDSSINTDDKPIIEFSIAKHFYKAYNINWEQEFKKFLY